MRTVILIPTPDFWQAWDWACDIEAAALIAAGINVEPRPWTAVGDLTGIDAVIEDADGVLQIMELELIEPALWLQHAPDKGAGFTAAIKDAIGG